MPVENKTPTQSRVLLNVFSKDELLAMPDNAASSATAALASEILAAAAADAAAAKADAASLSENAADLSATQAQIAALAAGAPLYTSVADGETATADGDFFMVYADGGVDAYTNTSGTATDRRVIIARRYRTVANFKASSEGARGEGAKWRGGPHDYTEAAADATDHHVTNAEGVKFYLEPNSEGRVVWQGLGPVSGAADHTALFSALFAAMQRAGTNIAIFGPGTWRGSLVDLPEGFEARCAKWLTVFRPVDADDKAIFQMDSGSAVTQSKGPKITGATFMGAEIVPTFSQFRHLVNLAGVDGAILDDCQFIGWRGDALIFSSGFVAGQERHNTNCRVTNCLFDGINNIARQSISFIDIDGVHVDKCVFRNSTSATMPGTIDFEPNNVSYAVIRNAWITNNRFINCGGNVGTITVFIPEGVTDEPENFFIEDNVVELGANTPVQGAGALFGWYLKDRVISATSKRHHVRVRGNRVKGTGATARYAPFTIWNGKDFDLSANVYEDCTDAAYVGYKNDGEGIDATARDIRISDKFVRCSAVSGAGTGMYIYTAHNVDLTRSEFESCGNGNVLASAINFKDGTSSRVKLNGLRVTDPVGGLTLRATLTDGAHTFTPATNQYIGNDVSGLAVDFKAHESDTLWTAYTPIAEGGGTAGVGSYSYQQGHWRRLGGQVFFTASIIQTSHTGAGVLELSIPVAVPPVSGNPLQMLIVLLGGVTSSGGQSGGINPAASADGIAGAIRCFSTGTGAKAGINLPTGAATYEYSGTYMAAAA